MSKKNMQQPLEDDLRHALKAEADEQRPLFSEQLHARIIESLPAAPLRPRFYSKVFAMEPRWRVAGTVAAALLLAATLIVWKTVPFGGDGSPRPGAVVQASPEDDQDVRWVAINTLSRANGAELGVMVDETFAQGQWAYLDHDAKVAADLLAGQLPFKLALAERR